MVRFKCPERVIKQTKLSNSKSYVLAVGSEDKSCCDLGRPGRCWKLQQKLSKTKVVRADGLVSECTLDPAVRNNVVDFPTGESMTQNTIIYFILIERLCTPTSGCS